MPFLKGYIGQLKAIKVLVCYNESLIKDLGLFEKDFFGVIPRIDVNVKGIDRFIELASSKYFNPLDLFIIAGPVYNSNL